MELTRKNHQVTDLGLIPNDWKVIPLEGICKNKGLVRGPFGGALKKESFVRDGIKVYEQQNAIYRDINLGDYYIDFKKYEELKRFEVKPNDFIVSCSGTIGKIFLIPNYAPKGIINQALLKITTDENVVSKHFFLHYFEWDKFQAKIIDSTQGGAMKNLVGMSVFRETKFAVPSLPEQTAIATALSETDTLIEGLEKLIAKKRNIKQGAMQELLKPHHNWKNKKLGEASILKARIGWQGLTTAEYKSSGDYFLITGTEFKKGFINWEQCVYVDETRYNQDKNIQIRERDILVTKDGTIGKVAFIKSLPKPATLNSGVFVIRPINDSFNPEFFFYLLTSVVFKKFLSQLSAGSTINHLYQKDFVSFMFKIPQTIKEQEDISKILSNMDSEVAQLEKKLFKYRSIKQGMMHALLTGKIRLL